MSDENPIEAGQFLGEDGAFKEDWRDYFPEEDAALRTDTTLAECKDIRSMAKRLVETKRMIGADKIELLNEQSTEEEQNVFHIKLGRPEKAEDYGFANLPEGSPRDDKFIAKMGQVCFEAGISKSAGAKIMAGYQEYYADLTKVMDTEDKIGNAEANKQLHTILGSAYDVKMASANLAIEALARPIDNEFAETLKKEMPYDVHATQFLAKIGEMIGEDKGLKGAAVESGFTPADARAKFNELTKDPYYVTDRPKDKPFNKAYHDELITQGEKLLSIANE